MNTKKLFSALLSVLIVLMMLPSAAFAAGEDVPNVLYVGTTNIGTTSYNDNAAYWTSADGGTTWTSQLNKPEGDSYIYYNGQGTLELHNVTIQGRYDDSNVFGAGIYALCGTNQSVSLTIQLTGNNTITGDFGIYVEAQQGGTLGANASLSITGDGSLTVTGTASYGLYVKSGTGNASLIIETAAVNAKTTTGYGNYAGVCVQSSTKATTPTLSLAVNGGSLTASSGTDGDGIQFYVGSSEANNATTSLTVTDNAIVDARTGGISASGVSVNPYVNIGSTGSTGGIVWNGAEGTVYGSATLQENLTIGEGETLTIPTGSSLDMGGKNITVASGGKLEGTPTGGTVVYAPTITTQPADQTVTEGGTATFTVAVTGSEPLTYQWQQKTTDSSSWTDIPGAKSATYTTEATTTTMNGYQYHCVVSNGAGSVTSEAATLTVNAKSYTITTTPSTLDFGSVTEGYTAAPEAKTVTVTNTGNQPVTVNLPSATNYIITAGTGFTNSQATLNVNETATFTVQPKAGLQVGNYSQNLTVSETNGTSASVTLGFVVAAKPAPTEYTIYFDANGGFVSYSSATTSGRRLASLPYAVKYGYTFTGWYTANGYPISTDTTFSANTTLYAGWVYNQINIPVQPSQPVKPVQPVEPEYEWLKENGGTRLYFDGKMITGWYQDEKTGVWYWLDQSSGFMAADQWVKVDGVWYLFAKDGSMLTGWQKVDGIWYYLKPWGGMATGWQYIDNVWYFLRSDGSMAANSWVLTSGKWYYLTGSGEMATNKWVQWKGEWYFLYSSGVMATNTTIDGYRINSAGVWVQ